MNRQKTQTRGLQPSSRQQNLTTINSEYNGQGYGHHRIDSQTGLLNQQNDTFNQNNFGDQNMNSKKSSNLNSQRVDFDQSQLKMKAAKEFIAMARQLGESRVSDQKGGITDEEYEKQMENIVNEYERSHTVLSKSEIQTISPNLASQKTIHNLNKNSSRLVSQHTSNRITQRSIIGNNLQLQSNLDVTNPILENIEQSFAQTRSNIASMIQQYGQDQDQLPDVDDILEEEDNIKEASQFRSRDIILRQRSGHEKNKYRALTTIIRDPDADLLQNETEAQILKIKRFCRRLCECCKKKEQLDDSFLYTSGESDLDAEEIFLGMDEYEQQNRIVELWQRTLAKARGAVKVIEIFGTYIPYKTAFIESSSDTVNTIELSIDSLFIIDIIVNFISAYEDSERNIEFRFFKIAQKYVTSWFIFDVMSCIPFQYLDFSGGDVTTTNEIITEIMDDSFTNSTLILGSRFLNTTTPITTGGTSSSVGSNSAKYSKLLKLTRLPRLYKLLRILRLFKMVRLLKYNRNIKKLMDQLRLNPGYMKMITVTVTVLFLVHLVSCFYFMVATYTDYDPESWVVRKQLIDDTNFAQYITAMYWAFQTLTTVGYGDVQGTTTFERIYCLLWMIFGVAFYSFTIGNLQSIISTIDVKASELSAKLNTLTGFAKRTKLPDYIVLKIKRFLENNSVSNTSLTESRQMLSELPSSLRAEVVKQTYAEIIEKVKFFNKKDSDFLWAFLPALKPMKVYSKDILYSQGDHPEEVFFIQLGRVKLCYDISEGENSQPINIPFNMYVEGSYFGDLEILLKKCRRQGRDGTAIVDSECHLLVIGSKELKAILKYFPDIQIQMENTANIRRKRHQKQIQEAKKKYLDRKVKALKNNTIFQNKNPLNQFSNWKKKIKKSDDLIKRAKASRRKLDMITSHKTGQLDASDTQSDQPPVEVKSISVRRPQPVNPQEIFRKGKTVYKKADSISNYDDSDEVEDEQDLDSDDESKLRSKLENQKKDTEKIEQPVQPVKENSSPTAILQQIKSRNSMNFGGMLQSGRTQKLDQQDEAVKRRFTGDQNSSRGLQRDMTQLQSSILKHTSTNSTQAAVLNNLSNFKLIVQKQSTGSIGGDIPRPQPQQKNSSRGLPIQTTQVAKVSNIAKQPPRSPSKVKPPQPKKIEKQKESKTEIIESPLKRKSTKVGKKDKKKVSNSSSKPDSLSNGFKHLKKELKEGQKIQSQYDHEKQMRLFGDVMSSLALNAFEINELNNRIDKQLEFRNNKLDKMDSQTRSIEGSLNSMEGLISKIMEKI
ncbi:cation channel family protein [Stylonychia lemnae]|uniref:Cation channel family protein n=1 Tax=Stylonychia lemnae TaxID=5949 RepID=A0A078B3J5_STYLE|nr:cation channel family protein [Stylonychia lemnae]|eukprot:CDW89105.1 cation channel family protein [Stylonychia lemnae]